MSGPKAKCPSCGTEWEGPVVFCGECGSPVAGASPQAERAPRVQQQSAKGFNRAMTLGVGRPGVPVSPGAAPPVPSKGVPPAEKPFELRRTVGGAAPSPPATAPSEKEAKAMRATQGGGKKRRGSAPSLEADAKTAAPADDGPQIEIIAAPISSVEPSTLRTEASVEAMKKPAPVASKPAQAAPSPVQQPKIGSVPAAAPAPASDPFAGLLPPSQPGAAQLANADPRTTLVSPTGAPAPAPPAALPTPIEQLVRTSSRPPVPRVDDDETQRMLEDLDAGFESIVRPTDAGDDDAAKRRAAPAPQAEPAPEEPPSARTLQARAARHEADMAEVRDLFGGIAIAYARPLRDFMLEVTWGEPTKDWLEVALPATQALRRAAAAVELPEVDRALEGFMTALELATGELTIDREVRDMLSSAYAKLVDAMPSVFALEGERVRREPIIVRSLLLQVPGVRHVAIDKLYRAGINSLEVFYAARPRELAEATGLDLTLCASICERFEAHRKEVAALPPGKDRERERAELESLADALMRQHEEHERAAGAWSPDAVSRRARARAERAATLLRIDVLLAQIGEVDLQHAIAKVPFQQKIRELYRYLDEAKQRAAHA